MSRRPQLYTSSAPPPMQAKGMVHKLVADTAKGMCQAVYQECALNNAWYAYWPDEDAFVRQRWTSFIQPARETLASMLNPENKSLTTEAQRQEIHEALLLNAGVNPALNHIDDYLGIKPN